MKKSMLALIALFTFASCSVVAEREEQSTSSVEDSSVAYATSADGQYFSTTYRDYTSGQDWRYDADRRFGVFPFITTVGKRNIQYSANGKSYWFNYAFDQNKKTVSYVISSQNEVIQKGETTVELILKNAREGIVKFNVSFDKETALPASVELYVKHSNAKGYEVSIPNSGLRALASGWKGSQSIVKNYLNGLDWRTFNLNSGRRLFHWLIRPYQKRTFNYYTANGERYWFNYTFFSHRSDVWYEVLSSKKGSIQKGWTHVAPNVLKRGGIFSPTTGRIEFMVEFIPETKLAKRTYLYAGFGLGGSLTHRGVMHSSHYFKINRGMFTVKAGHKWF